MALASVNALGATATKSSASSHTITVTNSAAAGSLVVVIVAKDNDGTSDAETNEVTSVTDSQSNTYTKVAEYSNGSLGASNGACCALFYAKLSTALTGSSDTITGNFVGTVGAHGVAAHNFSMGAGNTIAVADYTVGEITAHPGPLTLSSLTSREYLYVRGGANENNTLAGYTATDGTWTITDFAASSGGSAYTNMGVSGEYKIATSTGDTSDPETNHNSDWAYLLAALYEVSGFSPATIIPSLYQGASPFVGEVRV